jgi:hypothetical protein
MASAAVAADATFTGSTVGQFDAQGFGSPTTLAGSGLTFTGTTFSNTTVGGTAGFTLGSFSLTNSAFTYTGHTFQLQVTFTAPPGTGPNPGTFTATLTGQISVVGGSLFIDFANNINNPQTFTYAGGTFRFYVNDLTVQPGQSNVDLTGGVEVVPDGGSTVALLGLATVAAAFLRRKFSSSST